MSSGSTAGGAADSALTARLKAFALRELGADLVGVANIERFEHAPLMMSPQGLMPTAKSVVVMAVHHPDGCIEMGGIEHPQIIGPYRIQYQMNCRLDEMAYRLAVELEREGFEAMPIVSSNIWRYKGYKELTENFAPDVSHRHTAVAAGLADFGYSALAITPEYGARVRFVTVITDAVLEPNPLLEPGSVCDDCRLCVEECMSGALWKESRGTSVVRIEDKEYTYADKNLWRCAWGEHFDLDLDLEIPEVVDEEVILENVRCHGRRGGEMGSCLRYCVPPDRRYFDDQYTNAPRRKRPEPCDEFDRAIEQRVLGLAAEHGADFTVVSGPAELAKLGIDPSEFLPTGAVAVTVGLHYGTPEGADTMGSARAYLADQAAYDMTRELERHGYDAVCCTAFPEATLQAALQAAPGRRLHTHTVITNAPLAPTPLALPTPRLAPARSPRELRSRLTRLLTDLGVDAIGVSPAARLSDLRPHLAPIFDGMEVLVARDKSGYFEPYDPEIRAEQVRVKTPDDHLAGAKSVLVLALRLPRAAVQRTALPPAEAVGCYSFAQYEVVNLLRLIGYRAVRLLEDLGHRATLTFDLCGTGSAVANPRGEQPDAFCNRFAAVAAGLGRLTRAGFVVSPELGPHVRFVAIVTDAEIEANETLHDESLTAACGECDRCLAACRTDAFGAAVAVPVDGITERFQVIERTRCDWAKRYSLVGEEGCNYLGWDLHLDAPQVITVDELAAGLRQQPPIPKYRPCNFEACLMACPMTR